mgnify:CR=1 FL=1
MKKRNYITLGLGLIFIIFFLNAMFPAGGDKPKTEAKAFWKYIAEDNVYTDWKQWPGMEGMYEGQSPHGAFLKLYVNDKAYRAIKANEEMPDGAILVKENYGKDKKTLVAITPMYKSEGYNPDAGDWFWAKYSMDGDVKASGKVQSCIDCHMKVQDQEWLFTKGKGK